MSEHTDYMLVRTDEPELARLRDRLAELVDGAVLSPIPVPSYPEAVWTAFDRGRVTEEEAAEIAAETQAVWAAMDRPRWVPVSVVMPWPDGVRALSGIGTAIWIRVQEGGKLWRIVVADGDGRLWQHLMSDSRWEENWRDEEDDALLAAPAPTEGDEFAAMADALGVAPGPLAATLKPGGAAAFMDLLGADYLETHDQSYLAVTGATGARFEWDR